MEELAIATSQREEWIDVTPQIEPLVRKSGLRQGACLLWVPHTTAGITIQENADPDVVRDCLMALDRMVPASLPFRHSEGNSTAHVKSVLTGVSVAIPILDGRLALGTWQCVYFCEYDGPRRRRLLVSLTPEAGEKKQ
ncbi:MAG: secondary thiamine-phosphate synthase enzyme YjbQ [Candidatus Sumerlaeota bacterium]|nr:secondary thiamine-phosphate synthase enzyme YjbQ [Candidatus Sumerlaeota bacterium]